MKTPDSGSWHRTSPVAILFFLGRIVRLIARNAWQSIAPLFVYLSVGKEDLVTKLAIGASAFALVIVVASILSWLFFRYRISDDAVRIRSGVLKKKQLDIKFDRIQGINTQQNPVYRALRLVTVSFDTAGSAGNEGNLPAVTREFADALRKRIAQTKSISIAEDDAVVETVEPLLRLDWRDMVRIGLADRRALIVFALIGPLLEQMGDRVEDIVQEIVQSATAELLHFGVATGVAVGISLVIVVVLLLALASIAAAFLRYHNFELLLDGRTLRSSGGLLTRHEHSMDLGKIQTLRLQQGIVQSWLRRYRMSARQAVSGGRRSKRKQFVVPCVTATEADALRRRLLSPEAGRLTQDPRSPRFEAVSKFYMRSLILFAGVLPAAIATIVACMQAGMIGLLALLWLPLAVLLSWRSWQRTGFLHDDDEIVRRSGLLGFRTVGLLFRKVQRVTITQSRYQRRKGLASLKLHMASGNVRLPYIDLGRAQRLRDYILYKVESSQKAWH